VNIKVSPTRTPGLLAWERLHAEPPTNQVRALLPQQLCFFLQDPFHRSSFSFHVHIIQHIFPGLLVLFTQAPARPASYAYKAAVSGYPARETLPYRLARLMPLSTPHRRVRARSVFSGPTPVKNEQSGVIFHLSSAPPKCGHGIL
jgi:hypothetical protein